MERRKDKLYGNRTLLSRCTALFVRIRDFLHLLFYAACIAGLVFGILNNHWLAAGIALLIWLFRYTVQAIIINRTAKEMGGDRKYYFSLPVFDILQPIQSLKFKLYRSLRRKGDFMRR